MKLQRVEVQGFRSFTADQRLDFTRLQPGLYHVAGVNEVEPDLEGNGAGKSSLFESIVWGLYGKTSRGLRAGNVRNWKTKTGFCGVYLDVENGGDPFHIYRTQGPNKLEINGQPSDQALVDRIADMPFDAFLYSVFFGQFTPSFVDLPPAAQTELFTQVLNLQVWEAAADTASGEVSRCVTALSEARTEEARLQGRAQALAQQNFAAEEYAWNAKRDAALTEMDIGYNAAEDAVKRAAVRVKTLTKEQAAGKAALDAAQAAFQPVANSMASIAAMERQLKQLEARDITHCPVCGQPVDRKHLKGEIAKLKKQISAALLENAEDQAHFDDLKKRALELNRDQLLREAVAHHSKLSAEMRMMKGEADRLLADKNPYTAQRMRADEEGEQIVTQLEALAKDIRQIERHQAASQFWVKGFKEVRLMQIREAIDQLTIEANEVLFQLGLHDWGIEFDVERETKAGTIAKHFNVLIRAPHTNGAAVPWESWSGGESQRLRLSIAMGFANLIATRTGVQPNVEFWDEPSTWLSAAGIEALLTALADRAERHSRVILLADHRSLDFGGFTGTITIRKTPDGSLIEL
jgi:DNA repair exonuclease SbcCD ATPase subunit